LDHLFHPINDNLTTEEGRNVHWGIGIQWRLPIVDNPRYLHCYIQPKTSSSLWSGGTYLIEIFVPATHPMVPPQVFYAHLHWFFRSITTL
jgi:ubiquitin-protein ligase